MATLDRQETRDDVVAKITADSTIAQEVLGEMPKKFSGKSPVIVVESGPYFPGNFEDDGYIELTVSFWGRRDTGMEADVEDLMDGFALELVKILRKHYNAIFVRPSITSYDTIGGNPYRYEFHFVRIQWW